MNDGYTVTKVLEEYDQKFHVYGGLLANSERLLRDLLTAEKVRVMAITSRIKDRHSLSEKLGRPEKKYGCLSDVTDIVGLRVITFFEDDVDKVADLIAREFQLVPEHCVDRRAAIEPDRFGYRSLHYVCRMTPERRALIENVTFAEQVVEIQIRSILQHAWAEIEHDLGYKGPVTIPNEIKRQLSIVSGLLEIADRDFREIRDKSLAYRTRVSNELKLNQVSQLELDSISFGEYASTSSIVRELDAHLRDDLGYEIRPDTDQGLTLQMLKQVGITTVEELQRALTTHADLLKRYASKVLKNHFANPGDMWLPSGLSIFHLPQLIAARSGVTNLAQLYATVRLGPLGGEKKHARNIAKLVQEVDTQVSSKRSTKRPAKTSSKTVRRVVRQ